MRINKYFYIVAQLAFDKLHEGIFQYYEIIKNSYRVMFQFIILRIFNIFTKNKFRTHNLNLKLISFITKRLIRYKVKNIFSSHTTVKYILGLCAPNALSGEVAEGLIYIFYKRATQLQLRSEDVGVRTVGQTLSINCRLILVFGNYIHSSNFISPSMVY